MIQTLTRLFPLWAVLFSIFAFLFPGGLAQLSWAIVPLLMLMIIYTNRPLSDAMIE